MSRRPTVRLFLLLVALVVALAGALPAADAAARPTVTGLSASIGLPTGRTQVVLHGTGFTGAKVVHFGGVATTHFKVATDTEMRVISPAHGAGMVYVTVTTAGGTSYRQVADRFQYAAAPPRLVRSGLARTAPAVTAFNTGQVDLSCVSASFCVAGGNLGVASYDGHSWGAATSLAGHTATQVTCGSPTLCLAATDSGALWRFDGTTWTLSRQVDSVTSVSCGPAKCAAATTTGGNDSLDGYDGTTWTQQAGSVHSVSCFATGCLGTKVSGYRTFDGSWGDEKPLYENTSLNGFGQVGGGALSCVSASSCFLGDDPYGSSRSQYSLLRGSTWSYGLDIDSRHGGGVTEVSCASSTFCAARYSYFTSPNSSLSQAWYVVRGNTLTPFSASADAAVSCWAPYACMLLSPRHYYLSRQG